MGIFIRLAIRYEKRKEVNSLIGTYECKADAKGRFMLPAALKKQLLPVIQNGFVLNELFFSLVWSCIP